MIIDGFKEYKGSLKKVENLLKDNSKWVQGAHYTNSFLSQRYLTKSFVITENINTKNNSITLKFATRVEEAGVMEIMSTHDMLTDYAAGTVRELSTDIETAPAVDYVSVKVPLYSFDIELSMKDPEVTYQEFTLAGSKFVLVNLHQVLDKEKELEHTVTLIFGDRDRLNFFSHLFARKLTVRDTKLFLDLLMDENITGKAIRKISYQSEDGVHSTVFPYEELINSYRDSNGNYIFGTGHGYIKIPKSEIHRYTLVVDAYGDPRMLQYQIVLESPKSQIILITD